MIMKIMITSYITLKILNVLCSNLPASNCILNPLFAVPESELNSKCILAPVLLSGFEILLPVNIVIRVELSESPSRIIKTS